MAGDLYSSDHNVSFIFSPLQECKLPGFTSCVTVHPPRDGKPMFSINLGYFMVILYQRVGHRKGTGMEGGRGWDLL